ncbi:c-type cytochrome [Membranicola marinus]|uniref:C-type cytochrome n=1 Tax=Membranihabitans marinus TaxID=1227546 RepID=A0A953LA74_9BACT|nr:c-type cytochrome [Membranihabitans marinus]MBY5959625.1 c-type cytochrome [Membranihabitans marinus]
MSPTYFRKFFQYPFLITAFFFLFIGCSPEETEDPVEVSSNPKIAKLQLTEGFVADHLYSPIDTVEGSWVAMAFDDKNRLITSDQYGWLYRLEIPPIGSADSIPPQVEKLDINMGHAQGLLWAFNSLYVMVNNYTPDDPEKMDEEDFNVPSGLYRLRDTNGDDQLDSIQYLKPMVGWGEHGPHSIVLAPDGKSLFMVAGNHTDIIEMDHYRVPKAWDEDNILPQILDPRGHANERMAPGSWIAEFNPDGTEWTLQASGFRNTFDIAFNEAGDLFAYDSDMEWDLGMPWYRPTRICHATSGAEYGWRTGNAKWSPAWPDNLPPVVNLGQGSPTNLIFGTHARFPDKYKKMMFASDWSFGIVYGIQLTPDGATYKAEVDEFLSGLPLPLTDGVIGPDGAYYFMTGGRRIESDLYRVYHKDYESFDDQPIGEIELTEENKLRRQLERYHRELGQEAVDFAWPQLNHPDRFIRYAARVAIEHQPTDLWTNRVWSEKDPETLIQGAIALARQGDQSQSTPLFNALLDVDYDALDEALKVDFTRAVELIIYRMGPASSSMKTTWANYLNPHYPASSDELNRQLSKLLMAFDAPDMIDKTLTLLENATNDDNPDYNAASDLVLRNPQYGLTIGKMLEEMPPAQQTFLAIVLSEKESGWTSDLWERYFSWFHEAFSYKGGNSYVGFINHARKTALEKVPSAQREHYNEISGDSLITSSGLAVLSDRPKPKGPGRRWELTEALEVVTNDSTIRDFENGKNMFDATMCSSCHMMGRTGSNIGPDLTQLGTRFTKKDMLEAIIEPNNAISDQYAAKVFDLKNGNSVVGRLQKEDDEYYYVVQNPFSPDEVREVPKSDVRRVSLSTISMMPPGMVNSLNEEELKDLIAYLLAGGNENNAVYNENENNAL